MKKRLIKEFRKYVNKFDRKDYAINLKYNHSIRVMNISQYIAKKLNLSKEDIQLAILIGLLHDYGRFEQWTKYKTFCDLISLDHGDLGVNLLFESGDIKKYTNILNNEDILINAIKYHNKYSYPNSLDEKNKLFCNIIRDADKLDILNIFSNGTLIFEVVDDEISSKVRKDFFGNKSINIEDVENKNDEIILKLAMIYDLRYNVSFEYLDKKKYIWKIYNSLENKEIFLEYFNYIDKFIKERRIENVR